MSSHSPHPGLLRAVVPACLLGLALLAHGATPAAPSDLFEARIRPVLEEHCVECHGAAKQEGGLRLDSRGAVLRGGKSGPALVPGDPGASRLLRAIRHDAGTKPMPRERPALPPAVVSDFGAWIAAGAPDPRTAEPGTASPSPPTSSAPSAEAWQAAMRTRRGWWSFQPLREPAMPPAEPGGPAHPVDRFLGAKLRAAGLQPAPPAGREALLRRLTLVLTGLPPTPAERAAFLSDPSPDAYERVVDRLLASPRFGERWARHWMDLVRYCESHGSQGDPELPMAWRYRDYLVRAFNEDVPYDRFVREHVAGDLLEDPRIRAADGLDESAVGPAHFRMVEHGYVPVDALDDRVKVVDNQVDVLTKAFLALTVSCARCHDHKFDPVSQRDYYALYGILASCRPGQVEVEAPGSRDRALAELARLKEAVRDGLATAWEESAAAVPDGLRAWRDRRSALARVDEALGRAEAAVRGVESRARAAWLRSRGRDAAESVPVPMAEWTFEDDGRDERGPLPLRLESGARIRSGRLVLDGEEAHAVTPPLPVEVREKTLEAWVALSDLAQRGGGVVTVATLDSSVFDSIVFGEQKPGHWMAGSDFFRRTRDAEGPAETAGPDRLVHMAVVYRADNTIALYRDGQPYGKPYAQGTLTAFEPGKSRVVLGRRHLAKGVNAIRGEVEEARLHTRALSADEVRASCRAGPGGPALAEALALLPPDERAGHAALAGEVRELRARRGALLADTSVPAGWKAALDDAQRDEGAALHPWARLSGLAGEDFRKAWDGMAARWTAELASRRAFNRAHHTNCWRLPDGEAARWSASGRQGRWKPSGAGAFAVEPSGDRVLGGLYPAGVYSHLATRKEPGVYASPRFRIGTDSISVRALGEHSQVRVVVEDYAIGGGGIYPARNLDRDDAGWFRMDTAYRKGATAHFELVTTDDLPSPGLRSGGRPYADGRAGFGVMEVSFHDGAEAPREERVPAAWLLGQGTPGSADELAALYGRRVGALAAKWRRGELDDDEAAFLDVFVRRDLLPSTLARLPRVAPLVAEWRRVEASVPVPRRAPGLHDGPGFDQPLFARGVITRPGEPVPRGFPEVLGGRVYRGGDPGRRALADDLVRPDNPLAARVMVNRVWQHVFGRGIVGTADNFGRLGDVPTHPELLDHLALRFIRRGWSVKDLVRHLVVSEAFRRSAVPPAAAAEKDPANDLLSHARVRRLEAEAVRDSILAVAGQLDARMGGPGVDVYYTGKTEGGGPVGPLDGGRRRSVYQRVRRNAHNPLLEAFDAPKPSTTRGRRDATNVPAQALTLLNDPFVVDQAAKWAAALVAEGLGRRDRVTAVHGRALGRNPTAAEVEAELAHVAELAAERGVPDAEADHDVGTWQDFVQSVFCLKEFIYVE